MGICQLMSGMAGATPRRLRPASLRRVTAIPGTRASGSPIKAAGRRLRWPRSAKRITISSAPLPAPGSCLSRQMGRCPRGDVSAIAPSAPHRVTLGVSAVRSVRGRSGHGRTGPGDARVLSPPPVGYVIYGITRSARGTRRQPAAIHGYAPPECTRNNVTRPLPGV